MVLKRPKSPKSHAPILQESIQALSRGEPRKADQSNALQPALQRRIPVFTLGLKTLLRRGGLSQLKATSWRYLVRADGSLHVVDVADRLDQSESAALRQLRYGESGARLERAIRSSERHKKIQHRKYGLRLLRVPALHFSALWLKATAKKHDVLVPIRSMYPQLRTGRHYSREAAEAILRAGAERTLQLQN